MRIVNNLRGIFAMMLNNLRGIFAMMLTINIVDEMRMTYDQ